MPKTISKTIAGYTVRFLYGDGAYNVTVPALPGCLTWGKTLEEAEKHAKEAIGLHLDVMRDMGTPVPSDTPARRVRQKARTTSV